MPPKEKSRVRSRIKSLFNSALGRNEAPIRTPSSSMSTLDETTTPPITRLSSHLPSASISGLGISSRIKPESWASLQGLMTTLKQAASISGVEPAKNVIEGLVELIGLYEDAAKDRKESDDLRPQLERVFDELSEHLSSYPVTKTSMDSISWSIRQEIEVVKARQTRLKKGKSGEVGYDACVVLECYRRLQDNLQRLTRNSDISTRMAGDQLTARNCLQSLAASPWECYNSTKANELKRRSCTPGTRTDVLAQMHQWAANENMGNIYWMSGMAGTGKTTIAHTLCEQLDAKSNRLLCASFFCSRLLPECRDVGRIIPSIAHQLARYSQPFHYALTKATEQDPDAHTRLPQMQFDSLIVQPFADVEVRRTFPRNRVAVIDALDECDNVKSTKQILDVLLTKSKDIPIKFVVSSRPEPAIREQMEKNGAWIDARVVLHELESGEVKTDIKAYLKAELAPVQPLDSDIDRLAERAGVLFIYAATVVRYVGYDDFARGRTRLKAVLGASKQQSKVQTEEIDQLYGTILEAAIGDMKLEPTEREDIKFILDTVICAREPLTVTALNQLLQLDDVDRVHAALRPLWSVLHVMGPDMTVTTLHASFPDYLLDSKRSGTWHCDATTYHQLLARRCFDCIRDTKPRFNICRLESSYLLDNEVVDLDSRVQKFIPNELRYSCQYWSSHLDVVASATAPDLIPLLSQFLAADLLLWMEVRNLAKTLPAAPSDLTTAKRWAIRHGIARDMIDLLNDAWRFASTFVSSPVSQSTPHLYISMLPLLPLESPIRKHYWSQFKGMIGVEGTALERRKLALLAQWEFRMDVRCMACSPDGTRVAIGGGRYQYLSGRGCLHLLDTSSGTLLLDLLQGRETDVGVDSIAFSPNGTHLVSGRSDGVILIWDLTTGQPLCSPFEAHSDRVSSILYSHDSAYIVSASKDKAIRVWDALSGNPALTPLVGHTDEVTCIAITSDDAYLVSGSADGTIRVWDVKSGKVIQDPIVAYRGTVSAIALSPDDSFIVSGSNNGHMTIWNTQTGQTVLGPLRDHGSNIKSFAISPDGATIASTSDIDGLRVWDVTSGKTIFEFGPFPDVFPRHDTWATYSPDGTRVILVRGSGIIRLLDTQTSATASDPLPGHTRLITSIDISPNGRHVVSGSEDCKLFVWDVTQGALLVGPLHRHTETVKMVRFSHDGHRIVSCAQDKTIRQWDAQSGVVYGTLINIASAGYLGIRSSTYSRDGAQIVSLTYEGELSVWESSNGQRIMGPIAAPTQSDGVYADFSPDGSNVIAGYQDGSLSAWDVQNRQMVFSRPGPREFTLVTSLAFSPDGLHYAHASGALSRTISLKTIQTGEQMPGVFEGRNADMGSVRFSSNGTQLVSTSDKSLHVWNVDPPRPLFETLTGHTSVVSSVVISPDGKSLVSASWDIAIRIWNVEPKATSGQGRGGKYANWMLEKDGWVVSGTSRRLFWVPTDLHTSLIRPKNTILIYYEGYVRLKFDDAMIGEAWAGCFRGY